jgi:lipoprotein-anchoring transpeptidase ErfK/SrfK
MPRFSKAAATAAAVVALLSFAGVVRAEVVVTVDQATQRMTVVVDGEHRYTWPVSTGLAGTPSGSFQPYTLSRYHRSRLFANAPMPYAIFYSGHYAIHGTVAIAQLGARASKGCIRLHPSNAAVLFKLVQEHGLGNTRVVVEDSTVRVAGR